jgi:hypothetical protein
MLLAVVVAAVCIAGLIQRTSLWANAVATLAFALLAYGLVAIYMLPEKRSFYVPACIVGSLYLLVSLCVPLGLRGALVTDRLIFEWWNGKDGVVEMLSRFDPVIVADASVRSSKTNPDAVVADDAAYAILQDAESIQVYIPELWAKAADFQSLEKVVHSAIAIALGVSVGMICSYVARKRAGDHG